MPARTGLGNSPQRGIRGPSDEVWDAVAARAAENGETRNGALVRLLEEYARGQHRPRRGGRRPGVVKGRPGAS